MIVFQCRVLSYAPLEKALLLWEQHVEEVLQGMVRGGVSNEKDLIDR